MASIVSNMLEFNPYFRASPKNLLSNEIFSDIREFSREQDAPYKLKMKFDDEGAFDYEELRPTTSSIRSLVDELVSLIE